jgi:hypothetical protein
VDSRSGAFRDRLLRVAAPAVLALIACLQLYLADTHNLSPWKGGGFSMFSAVDRPDRRIVRGYLDTREGRVAIPVPDSDLRRKVRVMASPGRVSRLAQTVAGSVWVLDPPNGRDAGGPPEACGHPAPRALSPAEPVPAGATPIAFSRVELEVWKVGFHSSDRTLRAQKLITVAAERR